MKRRILFCCGVLCLLFISFYFYRNDPTSIIPDRKLQAIVRETIGKPRWKITPEDCLGVTKLDVLAGVKRLDGLEYFSDLEILFLGAGTIRDLKDLKELKKLKELRLLGNAIYDFSPLTQLPELEYVELRWTPRYNVHPTDLSPLNECEKEVTVWADVDFYTGYPVGVMGG